MAQGNLTGTASSDWFKMSIGDAHISVNGTFGGSVAVEKLVNGNTYPVYEDGSAITMTAADDFSLLVGEGDIIRLTSAGVTSVDWSIANRQMVKHG